MSGVQKFLLVSGIFIIAVGLFYGSPKPVIENAFEISIDDNSLHIFRAIMGLYCGVGILVLLGAKKPNYTRFSLLLETAFFGGVGIGRLISLVIDGNIRSTSVNAIVGEIVLFAICLFVLRVHSRLSEKTGAETV